MWTGKGGGDHLSFERSAGPRLVACLPSQEKPSAVCPGAEVKFCLQDATCAKSKGAGTATCWGKGSQGAKLVLRVEKCRELPAPPLVLRDVYPCCVCPHGSQRETNSFEIHCAKWSSTCVFPPKTLAPGVQDRLGTRCAKASKTKTRSLLSWSLSEPYLGILLLSPFPQGTASWQDLRGSIWSATSLLHSRLLQEGVAHPREHWCCFDRPELSVSEILCRAAVPSPHTALQRENRS